MQTVKYDVVGIGNAIVDVLANVGDRFLERHELKKGTMMLIDEAKAISIYNAMPPAIQVSGGSAANTVAGVASLGGKSAFIGKVHQDDIGEIFRSDLQSIGVRYDTNPTIKGPQTARSFIAVTPDAQRTMATYLGAAQFISTQDIDEAIIKNSKVTYLEGYLWDDSGSKEAMRYAMKVAVDAGNKVAFSLSDMFCVERHRDEFLSVIDEYVDILFGNEAEIKSLLKQMELEEVLKGLQGVCEISVVTLGAKGSVIATKDRHYTIAPYKVEHVIDTTGAGDLYASGFLYGYSKGLDIENCGQLGSMAASEIISHLGARPQVNLESLARSLGLLGKVA